ncbi:MAG: hypothetical protein ABEJ07_01515 [Candidatus Nanohaloarchaea archaeon]
MTECKICGRTEDELEEEFGREIPVKEHEGLKKCQKCLSEYQRETGETSTSEGEEESEADWKKAVTA